MDPESTPPNDASEQGGNAGDDGARGGASSDADAFAAERTALEAKARDQQSRADKAQAELDRLKAQIAEQQAPAPTDNPEPAPVIDLAQVRREALAGSLTAQEMAATVPTLKDAFPEADPAIYQRLVEFESVESLRAAVEASHSKRKADADALREKVEAEVRQDFAEKYGIEAELRAPEPDAKPGDGEPTLEQLNAMSIPELQALEAKSPGITRRISGVPERGGWGGGWSG